MRLIIRNIIQLSAVLFGDLQFMLIQNSFFRFVLVGVSNTAIGMSVIYIAWSTFRLGDMSANVLGYVIGFLWSFAINRLWTFHDNGAVTRSFTRFALVCAVAYAANLLVLFATRSAIGEASFLPHVFGAVTYTILGYLGSRFFVFKHPQKSNAGAADRA
jgi:putative flippase GtrA